MNKFFILQTKCRTQRNMEINKFELWLIAERNSPNEIIANISTPELSITLCKPFISGCGANSSGITAQADIRRNETNHVLILNQ